MPPNVATTPGQLGGVPVIRIDIPGTTTPNGVIMYFHGGFFAIGSAPASVGLASDLARKARMQVVTVDYRLDRAPLPRRPRRRHDRLPGPVDSGQDVARLALAGESAGATLAVVTLAAIARTGLPQPTSAVLMSPWADLAGTGDSLKTKADVDPVITPMLSASEPATISAARMPATRW